MPRADRVLCARPPCLSAITDELADSRNTCGNRFCPTQPKRLKSCFKCTGSRGFLRYPQMGDARHCNFWLAVKSGAAYCLGTPHWGRREISSRALSLPTSFMAPWVVAKAITHRRATRRRPHSPRGAARVPWNCPSFRAFTGSARTECRPRRWDISAVSARSTRQDEAPRRARRRSRASPAFLP
jgi:hypothetical protein